MNAVPSRSRATSSRGGSTALSHVSLLGVVIRIVNTGRGGGVPLTHSFILFLDRGSYLRWTRQAAICLAAARSRHIWVARVPSSPVRRPAVTSPRWVCGAAQVSTTRGALVQRTRTPYTGNDVSDSLFLARPSPSIAACP